MQRDFPSEHMEIKRLDQLVSQLMIRHEGTLQVVVKDEDTRLKILDFLKLNGYTYQFKQMRYETVVNIELQNIASMGEATVQKKPTILDQVLIIHSDQFGTGDELYGQGLMQSLIIAWVERNPLPAKIIFMNSGVKMLSPSSLILDSLRNVQTQGVELYVSSGCMAHYGIQKTYDFIEEKTLFQLVQHIKNAKNTITL